MGRFWRKFGILLFYTVAAMFLGVEYLLDGEPVRVALDRRDQEVRVATRDGRCVMKQVGHTERVVDAWLRVAFRRDQWPQ